MDEGERDSKWLILERIFHFLNGNEEYGLNKTPENTHFSFFVFKDTGNTSFNYLIL